MKVCHVFASREGGRWVSEQLEALKREHGFEVVVLLPGDGPTADLCRRTGIRAETFNFDFKRSSWRRLFSFPLRVIRLASWLRRERFDVVQSHLMNSTMFARPAAWLADIPVRLTMSTSPYYLQSPSLRWFEAGTTFMETGVIPSCNITTELYRAAGVPERRIMPCLYYGPHEAGFDPAAAQSEGLRAEMGVPEGTPLVGSIAIFYDRCRDSTFVPPECRNRFIKGHCDLIQAMHHVRGEFPEARLVMVGCGWGPRARATEQELRSFVRDEGLEEAVYFAGWRDSTPAILVDLDVSVQASVNENLGGTIESLLMARPTVATRVGGMVDSVVDGKTGILVNPEDPRDLARGICDLLRDPERGAALGKAGRAHMLAGFTLTSTVPRLAEIYLRQRAEARGAWRARMFASRLLLGALIAGPIVARLLWHHFFLNALPAGAAGLRDRLARLFDRRVARGVAAKRPL